MDNGLIGLIGLARKGGRLEAGEEPVSAAAKAHKARLVLLASDAGERTCRHGGAMETDNCPVLTVPLTKEALGAAAGRGACAILAFTDVGLAAAAVKKLAQTDPEAYGQAAQRLTYKAEKTLRRRRETQRREKEVKAKGAKPWAPPPAP